MNTNSLDWKLKRVISEFDEISTAKVILDEEDTIVEIEIHLKTASIDSDFLISRIQHLIEKETGKKIDTSKFRVVSDGKSRISPQPKKVSRERPVLLEDITSTTKRHSLDVKVTLNIGGTHVTGTASGVFPRHDHVHIAAEATLNALSDYSGVKSTLSIADTGVERLRNEDIVVVLIDSTEEGGLHNTFVGSSILKVDIAQSAAYATLDGLNRYLRGLNRK
jgi:hypothetical protein